MHLRHKTTLLGTPLPFWTCIIFDFTHFRSWGELGIFVHFLEELKARKIAVEIFRPLGENASIQIPQQKF
jgi:hypothetical protein